MDVATRHAAVDTIRFAAWCLTLVVVVYMPSTIRELWREGDRVGAALMVLMMMMFVAGAITITVTDP